MDRFTIGPWTVDPGGNTITAGQTVTRVEPRLMTLLALLASRRGEVVPRTELLEHAWDTPAPDEALTQAVSALRRLLGDDARVPRFIETVPKRGYRLLREPGGAVAAPATGFRRPKRPPLHWIAASAVAALLLHETRNEPPLERRYVTSARGRESQPAVSPDGERIAFVGNDGGSFDLHLAGRAGTMQRLTHDEALEGSPAWSVDGARLAFVVFASGTCRIDLLTVATGSRRTLAACNAAEAQVAWAADGRSLVVADRAAHGAFGLSLIDAASGVRRTLTDPRGIHGDRFPAVRGADIAFVRTATMGASDIHLLDGRGKIRRITNEGHWMSGLTWIDDERLLVSSNRGGSFGLWEVATDTARWKPRSGDDAVRPSASAQLVAYEEQRFDSDVVTASLHGADAPRPWMPSTREDREPSVAPDGRSVAFISARSGRPQLWLSHAGALRQRTFLHATTIMTPRWSGDGTRIVFAAMIDGRCEIHVHDLRTGRTHRETEGVSPSFGIDGATIYFSSNRGGRWRAWARSSGQERVVIDAPAGAIHELPDGSLLYSRMDAPGLWRKGSRVAEGPRAGAWGSWDVAGDRVYFVHDERLNVLDLSDGRTRVLRPLDVDFETQGLSVAPNASVIYYAVRDARESDIVLVPRTRRDL